MPLVAGVDEAGRGPVLGPMVIAIAVAEASVEQELKKIGAKDSKLLSPKVREKLYSQIKQLCSEFYTVHISAAELNELMPKISLNEIEAMKIADLIKGLKQLPDKITVDSPDPEAARFEARIRKYVDHDGTISAEHKADFNHPIASAASILAKVERDQEIEKIKKELGADFGSGYSHDERTIKFLKENMARPDVKRYVRERWATMDNLKQRKLGEFPQE